MTLEECYKNFGGDYQEVENRLCSRKFVEKFLVKFLADKSYENLHHYLDEGDLAEAFRAAHTLKALRGGKNEVAPEMLQKLDDDYQLVVQSIQEYQKSAE